MGCTAASSLTSSRPAARKALQDAIDAHDFNSEIKIGFDPTHIETTGLTIAEAQAGKRPT